MAVVIPAGNAGMTIGTSLAVLGTGTLVFYNLVVKPAVDTLTQSLESFNVFKNGTIPNPITTADDFIDKHGYRQQLLEWIGYNYTAYLSMLKTGEDAEPTGTNTSKAIGYIPVGASDAETHGADAETPQTETLFPEEQPASDPQLEQGTIWWKSLVCLIRERGIGDRAGCIANHATSDLYAVAKVFAALGTIAWLTSPGNPQPTQNTPQQPAYTTASDPTMAYRHLGQSYPGASGQFYYPYKA